MTGERKRKAIRGVLGLEGGGTKTTWVVLDEAGHLLKRGRAGAGNTQYLTDGQTLKLFREIARETGREIALIGGAFAGCHLVREKQRLQGLLGKIWPQAEVIVVGEDTKSAMAGAHGEQDGIIVIAGTGANVVGRRGSRWEKTSGWGSLFSDEGSGYDLARRGLQAVYRHYAATQKVTRLGQEYLRATAQNTLEELVPWMIAHESKTEVASLAPCVFRAANRGDKLARQVIATGLRELAQRVDFVARRLKLKNPSIGLVGSLFEKNEGYARAFGRAVKTKQPGAKIFVSRTPGEVGSAHMVLGSVHLSAPIEQDGGPSVAAEINYAAALTEQRNPRSHGLDQMSVTQLVDLFILEENKVETALHQTRAAITRACELVAGKITRGGRLFYVGGGHQWPAGGVRCERNAPDVQRGSRDVSGDYGRGSGGGLSQPGRSGR